METKKRIIIETLKLFMRYGIKSITMDRIADDLCVSKRTIYELFKDKDGLVENCLNQLIAEEKKISKDIMIKSDNAIDAFIKRIKRSITLLSSVNEVFLYDVEKYHYSVFQRKGRQRNEIEYEMLIEFIQQGKREGYFRKDIDEAILARLVKEQVKIVVNVDLFPSDRFDKTVVFENIAINFIRGISTDKGLIILEKYKY